VCRCCDLSDGEDAFTFNMTHLASWEVGVEAVETNSLLCATCTK
jgi:hypothetical protein